MQTNEIGKLAEALAKAQGCMKNASKEVKNTYFKSSYADLAAVWEVCRKPLSDNGLAVTQACEYVNGILVLSTTLAHSSGEWMRSQFPCFMKEETSQALGSAITYMRRYALMAMVGVAASDEDDDGEAAEGRGNQQGAASQTTPNPAGSVKPAPGQPFRPITEKQAAFLMSLINKRQEVHDAILDMCNVPYIDDIPATMFDSAMKIAREYVSQKVAV